MSSDANSRRHFLKTALTVTAGLTAAPALARSLYVGQGRPNRLGVLVDTTLCIGLNCRRCEFACAKEQGLPPPPQPPEDESVFLKRRRMHADQYTVVNRFPGRREEEVIFVKRQCMHCEEPACASACFVKALRKTSQGPVVYDPSVCVGCRYCMIACPFDVPAYEYGEPLKPRVRKCTMCFSTRIKEGRRPACIEACPNEVMTLGPRNDLIRLAYQKIARSPERYTHHLYGEHEVGGTAWMYLAALPMEQLGFPKDVGTTPLCEYTRTYLSAAPLIMAMWPALFTGIYLFTRRREELRQAEQNGRATSAPRMSVDTEQERH